MMTTTVTGDGTIALGDGDLCHLGVSTGSTVSIRRLANGTIALERAPSMATIADVFGMLRRCGQRPVPIEELNVVSAEAWAGIG